MTDFTVHEIVTHGQGTDILIEQRPIPAIALVPGDVLVVTYEFITPNGNLYALGMELTLIEKTTDAPHRRTSSLGNWVVKCPYQTSVWAKIEYLQGQGNLTPRRSY